MVKYFGCYPYNEEWLLVEMVLDTVWSEIDWNAMAVPHEELDEEDWQCPYMEQYLNSEGTEKLCEVYDEPEEDGAPVRVAFFLYREDAEILRTPYGDFDLTDLQVLPARLSAIIEFDNED